MAFIAESEWLISGDIGGIGITRFRWALVGFTAPVASDCNSALSAQHALIAAFNTAFPAQITWTPQASHRILDPASGLVNSFVNATTVPAAVNGVNGSDYAAGVGCRIDWKTSTVRGRRLLRSASFMVPMAGNAFDAFGAVNASVTSAGTTAANTYLASMVTAGLAAVAWHRPAKGATTGGLAATITSGSVQTVPAGLRSRRS